MPETALHLELKSLARGFLYASGYAAHAAEVACSIQRYRVDAAGWSDREFGGGMGAGAGVRDGAARPERCPAHTAIIECKASRADFLRDDAELPRLLGVRDQLRARLAEVREEVVHTGEPELRRAGTFLFGDLDPWDYDASRSVAHRLVVRELRRLDRLIHHHTKFFMLAHYRLADRLWVLAPRGMIEPRECPAGWGLLERLDSGEVRETVAPACGASHDRHRARMLRNIAVRLSAGAGPDGSAARAGAGPGTL